VAAGNAAIAEYDTNHDGTISGKELDKCPALKTGEKHYADAAGKITAESLAEGIARWQENRIAITRCGIMVTMDAKPLAGAAVTAEPEKFLGPEVQTAAGVTDLHGGCTLRIPGQIGMQYGLYRVRVRKSVEGKETIRARYNAKTELGLEVAPGAGGLGVGGAIFNLKSQ